MTRASDVLGHQRHALDLPEVLGRLLGELPVLLEQRLDLGGQGPHLALDGRQGLLRRARGPGQLEQGRDGRDHEREEREARDQCRRL